ncbi:YgeY family selenium metabolism-linked hydrolase [Thermomicrobiaceae bacterium CFH 74404]|uniref:YgeY family selenium metabolism-linked hydrolase n=1 Tax=Thermalbibacter longus TaxID=2951981 RepID=A0AA42B9B5_9BACT|nr:YgeY family selenium metabolism-linked hydrolase [Thermalbibacter longus]MCM8748291.1 YgeY family selenium metabolism-linked hydrolase [Thermalbibacter longus]
MTGSVFPFSGEAIADFTLRLIRTPSPSGQEDGVARLVFEEMAKLGFKVQIDAFGNVIGTVSAGPGPAVLLDAHMDTVGVSSPELWTRNPWGERVGDRIYGRGAMDMKGPLAAAVYGIAALRGRLERGTVVVSATVAEELVEGPALVRVAERLRPDFVVICEATSLKLARGQRGRAEVRVEVFGKPTHSSRPELGVNAAEAMVDVVRALRELQPPRHPVLGPGILVLTDVKSEPYPGLSVVPDYCLATYDRRTLPGELEDDILQPIRTLAERALEGSGAHAQVAIAEDDFQTYTGQRIAAPNFAPAWFFDEDAPIVAGAVEGLRQAGIAPELSHYAFCTNGSGTAGRLGIPTIGFGPGDEELAHRVDEYIDVDELVLAARGYAAIACQLVRLGG